MKSYVVVRDPDYENEITVVEGDEAGVVVHNVDLGRADLRSAEAAIPWAVHHLDAAAAMPREAKDAIVETVWNVLTELPGLDDAEINLLLDGCRSSEWENSALSAGEYLKRKRAAVTQER